MWLHHPSSFSVWSLLKTFQPLLSLFLSLFFLPFIMHSSLHTCPCALYSAAVSSHLTFSHCSPTRLSSEKGGCLDPVILSPPPFSFIVLSSRSSLSLIFTISMSSLLVLCLSSLTPPTSFHHSLTLHSFIPSHQPPLTCRNDNCIVTVQVYCRQNWNPVVYKLRLYLIH